jgi:hypothetical protein
VLGFEGELKCDVAGELGYPAFSYKELTAAGCSNFTALDLVLWPDKDEPGAAQCKSKAQMMPDSNH